MYSYHEYCTSLVTLWGVACAWHMQINVSETSKYVS